MIGVVGYAPDNTYVVRDASEVAALPQLRSPLVVSQTTIKLKTFLEVAEAVRAKADAEPQVVNTICSATRDRQDAARALAGQVDAFYVIGGRHSSNSVKLLAVCQEQCAKSFLIETPAEINPADLGKCEASGRDCRGFNSKLVDRSSCEAAARDWVRSRCLKRSRGFSTPSTDRLSISHLQIFHYVIPAAARK